MSKKASIDTSGAAIDHLIARNVSNLIKKEELENMLRGSNKLKVYLGIDPSAPEIHLGNAVVLWKLREFQDLGHEVILLIGDFTAQIGDPTGKNKQRVPLSHEQVMDNARTYRDQAKKILRVDGENPAKVLFNSKWLEKLTFGEIIKLASDFTVQQLIERDMFQERLKAGHPIGLHEFLYPLMQGYDSVAMEVDVEVGGNDQLFNIIAGRTLLEKVKKKKKVVLTCDLLTGSNGAKMSKSAGNVIPLGSTPIQMFGQLMTISDKLIEEYARLCSDMDGVELKTIAKRLKSKENPRDVKLDVAERIVARYSSSGESVEAREKFIQTFSKNSETADLHPVENFFPAPMPEMQLSELVATVASKSKSEARRLIEGGAVDIDSKTYKDPTLKLDLTKAKVARIGKHQFVRIQYLPNAIPKK